MTGPEHNREAERLLSIANGDDPRDALIVATAQVHATLALAAATAYPAIVAYTGDEYGHEGRGWANVTAPKPVRS